MRKSKYNSRPEEAIANLQTRLEQSEAKKIIQLNRHKLLQIRIEQSVAK
jgi:UDP-N-acetyl-D-mannosaminuronic acid transferase (WecB/TagA/CpsF family)